MFQTHITTVILHLHVGMATKLIFLHIYAYWGRRLLYTGEGSISLLQKLWSYLLVICRFERAGLFFQWMLIKQLFGANLRRNNTFSRFRMRYKTNKLSVPRSRILKRVHNQLCSLAFGSRLFIFDPELWHMTFETWNLMVSPAFRWGIPKFLLAAMPAKSRRKISCPIQIFRWDPLLLFFFQSFVNFFLSATIIIKGVSDIFAWFWTFSRVMHIFNR